MNIYLFQKCRRPINRLGYERAGNGFQPTGARGARASFAREEFKKSSFVIDVIINCNRN